MTKKQLKKLKPTQKALSEAMMRRVHKGMDKGDAFDAPKVHKNYVIDGHHRVQAMKERGMKTAKVKQASKDDILKALRKRTKK
jgi:hypothetical protein